MLNMSTMLGFLLKPIAWLMGVSWDQAQYVGQLLGVKTILNEFVAYSELGGMLSQNQVSGRSAVIATYALCGFQTLGQSRSNRRDWWYCAETEGRPREVGRQGDDRRYNCSDVDSDGGWYSLLMVKNDGTDNKKLLKDGQPILIYDRRRRTHFARLQAGKKTNIRGDILHHDQLIVDRMAVVLIPISGTLSESFLRLCQNIPSIWNAMRHCLSQRCRLSCLLRRCTTGHARG